MLLIIFWIIKEKTCMREGVAFPSLIKVSCVSVRPNGHSSMDGIILSSDNNNRR